MHRGPLENTETLNHIVNEKILKIQVGDKSVSP